MPSRDAGRVISAACRPRLQDGAMLNVEVLSFHVDDMAVSSPVGTEYIRLEAKIDLLIELEE